MQKQTTALTPRVILQVVFFIFLIPLLPLLITWQWNWVEAWIYALIYIASFVISRMVAAHRSPGLIAERARMFQHEDAKEWDKQLAPLLGIVGLLIPLIAGFDARFGWSPEMSLPLKFFAVLLMLGGMLLGSYALIENSFFSGMVRIQTERNHHVISSGPYRWIRHPGYVGAILTYWATPLLLDALWVFVPVVLSTIILVIRTHLEDQTLQHELEGYAEYARRVPYRLLPGLW